MPLCLVADLEDIAKNSQNLIRQRCGACLVLVHDVSFKRWFGGDKPCIPVDRVAATACVYFRRFYLKENFCEYDPRLVGPACLFLACKSEESQVQAKVLFQMLKKVSTTGEAQAASLISVPFCSTVWSGYGFTSEGWACHREVPWTSISGLSAVA